MNPRLRGAAVIVHGNRIAFARHSDEVRNLVWWSPPGGAVEGEEPVYASAEREALEETSLRVVAERPIYAQELIDHRWDSHTLELFILCHLADGVSPDEIQADNEIDEARFLTEAEAADLLMLPAVFHQTVWDDLRTGFPVFRYLGVTYLGRAEARRRDGAELEPPL